jgi:hypothetical protein
MAALKTGVRGRLGRLHGAAAPVTDSRPVCEECSAVLHWAQVSAVMFSVCQVRVAMALTLSAPNLRKHP